MSDLFVHYCTAKSSIVMHTGNHTWGGGGGGGGGMRGRRECEQFIQSLLC